MESLLQKVKSKMFIFAHRRAKGLLDGEYGSVFKGRSLDFDDLRAYIAGDEVRDIDWKATARHGSPLIKRYVAVRKQNVLLVTDTGTNMAALSRGGELKRDVAVMALGVVGYLAVRHSDTVALVCGDSVQTRAVPARGSEGHLELLLRTVHRHTSADSAPSNIEDQLRYIARSFRQRHLIFVVADELEATPGLEQVLRRLAAQHEILWLTLEDAELIDSASTTGAARATSGDVHDVGQGRPLLTRLSRRETIAAQYREHVAVRDAERKALLRRVGVVEGRVGGSGDVMRAIFDLLERHRRAKQ
ncbi:DUF58 domain-containing protein [Pseudarthrobacter sp. J1763]|uniref:DUF58 domain-containing protein n=1 Tax=Pseudarthrobacter sp. J1763 TaxID=3420445 RepID=UPI003D2895D2